MKIATSPHKVLNAPPSVDLPTMLVVVLLCLFEWLCHWLADPSPGEE